MDLQPSPPLPRPAALRRALLDWRRAHRRTIAVAVVLTAVAASSSLLLPGAPAAGSEGGVLRHLVTAAATSAAIALPLLTALAHVATARGRWPGHVARFPRLVVGVFRAVPGSAPRVVLAATVGLVAAAYLHPPIALGAAIAVLALAPTEVGLAVAEARVAGHAARARISGRRVRTDPARWLVTATATALAVLPVAALRLALVPAGCAVDAVLGAGCPEGAGLAVLGVGAVLGAAAVTPLALATGGVLARVLDEPLVTEVRPLPSHVDVVAPATVERDTATRVADAPTTDTVEHQDPTADGDVVVAAAAGGTAAPDGVVETAVAPTPAAVPEEPEAPRADVVPDEVDEPTVEIAPVVVSTDGPAPQPEPEPDPVPPAPEPDPIPPMPEPDPIPPMPEPDPIPPMPEPDPIPPTPEPDPVVPDTGTGRPPLDADAVAQEAAEQRLADVADDDGDGDDAVSADLPPLFGAAAAADAPHPVDRALDRARPRLEALSAPTRGALVSLFASVARTEVTPEADALTQLSDSLREVPLDRTRRAVSTVRANTGKVDTLRTQYQRSPRIAKGAIERAAVTGLRAAGVPGGHADHVARTLLTVDAEDWAHLTGVLDDLDHELAEG